ncbi:hypothetical protein D3C76_1151420 [compost metagenome]
MHVRRQRGFTYQARQVVADPGLQLDLVGITKLQGIAAQIGLQIKVAQAFAGVVEHAQLMKTGIGRPVPAIGNALVVALQRENQRQLVQVAFNGAFADGKAGVFQAGYQLGAGGTG